MSHTGRIALVTGAGRGLGRAIALTLASEGISLAVGYRRDAEAAETTAQACRELGVAAATFAADLERTEAVPSLVEGVTAQLGAPTILVANAGVGRRQTLVDASLDDFEATLRTNLTASFALAQAVLPTMMAERWGRMIFLSSIAARTGGVISAAYAASKGGIEGMMHYYATQLLSHGVTANALAPAFIETDMFEGITLPPPEQMPLGRMGRPEEVGEAARLLIRSGFITGQTLHINAGRHMS